MRKLNVILLNKKPKFSNKIEYKYKLDLEALLLKKLKMSSNYLIVLIFIQLNPVNANYVYGNFLHCDIKGSCNTYDHIIIGCKVDKCTEDLLIKYQKGGRYVMAFLNDNGYIVDQSILKNCSN